MIAISLYEAADLSVTDVPSSVTFYKRVYNSKIRPRAGVF
jgi:hypothetical protein